MAKKGALLLVIGIVYAVFVGITNIGIPCPIRLITGYQCPGCGITHMAMALLSFDLKLAYESNQVLFCLGPILIALFARYYYRYIRYGVRKFAKWENGILYVCCGILVVWGIIRNIL